MQRPVKARVCYGSDVTKAILDKLTGPREDLRGLDVGQVTSALDMKLLEKGREQSGWDEVDRFATFQCSECGVETDIEIWRGRRLATR